MNAPPAPFATWLDWAAHYDTRNYGVTRDYGGYHHARAELAALRERAARADALTEALAAAERVIDVTSRARDLLLPSGPPLSAAMHAWTRIEREGDKARAALAAAKAAIPGGAK